MTPAPSITHHHITDAERDAFGRDGFVAIADPVVSKDGLDEAERLLNREFERSLTDGSYHDLAAGTAGSPQIHEIINLTRRTPALMRTEAFLAVKHLAAELLAVERVRLHFDHAILKPAHNGAPTGWHQDLAFDPDHDIPMATIWLSFCDVDARGGCMRYVPGSHRLDLLEHHSSGHDGKSMDLDPATDVVICELPRGGVSIHGARTIHGSGTNDSDVPRLAWITKFVPEDRSRLRAGSANVMDRVSWRLRPPSTAARHREALYGASPRRDR